MKKLNYTIMVVIAGLCSISWGTVGHRTVARIAENHLTEKTKRAVKSILGFENLVDVSNEADDMRSNPNYRYTAPWHFANIPAGYDFVQFADAVKNGKGDNVYKIVLHCEYDLANPERSKREKADALKLLVHFVGDLHQPMHVSRAEDKGGNNISIKFLNENNNLHELWDSRLIEHERLNYQQLANVCDTATPEQIKKWQSDNLLIWLWESYQISNILYQEAADNPDFGETYYKDHLSILNGRLEKAGIRLAGILNNIFDKAN